MTVSLSPRVQDALDGVLEAYEKKCGICGRALNVEGDPSSADCGGDCWRCIAECENDQPIPGKENRVSVDYTNYRGERSIRSITPWTVTWGSSEYHTRPQWLLTCYDHEKFAVRVYALADIHAWNGVPTSEVIACGEVS